MFQGEMSSNFRLGNSNIPATAFRVNKHLVLLLGGTAFIECSLVIHVKSFCELFMATHDPSFTVSIPFPQEELCVLTAYRAAFSYHYDVNYGAELWHIEAKPSSV